MTSQLSADITAPTTSPPYIDVGARLRARALGPPGVGADPTFVPGRLVHKEHTDQVRLTGGTRLAPDEFLITATLPVDADPYHFRDQGGGMDLMLVAEAVRQCGYYVSHRFHGVPQTHVFVLGELTLESDGIVPTGDEAWLPVALHVTCVPTARWTRRRVGMRLAIELSVGGRVCGHGSLRSEAMDERVHRAVRRRVEPSPSGAQVVHTGRLLSPGEVGRRAPTDVVLAGDASADTWRLCVDRRHPVMFDHTVDHVPGMVLIEAFRQAALAATGRRYVLSGMRTEFVRYCEPDAPTRITAVPEPGPAPEDHVLVRVAAEQEGAQVATGAVTLRQEPSPHDAVSR